MDYLEKNIDKAIAALAVREPRLSVKVVGDVAQSTPISLFQPGSLFVSIDLAAVTSQSQLGNLFETAMTVFAAHLQP